jgi:hypothetical protein
MHPLVRRLLSPAGFLLVVFCFALPFLAMSCEAPGVSARAMYTGADLVVGGEPSVTVNGRAPDEDDAPRPDPLDPQPLAVIAFAVVVAGLGTVLLPGAWLRSLAGATAAATAAILLAAAQVLAARDLRAELARGGALDQPDVRTAIQSQNGFWLAMALLAAVTLGSAVAMLADRRRAEISAS